MGIKDSLGDRLKQGYEDSYRIKLPIRMPVIVRIDGKAFSNLTRGLDRPWDEIFMNVMDEVALALCEGIMGAQVAYAQSDEISILMHNYKRLTSEAWFGNNLQKIVSVSASIATAEFYKNSNRIWGHSKAGLFDSRAFVLPEAEVNNYFLWRQQDATRNAIQSLGQYHFSHSRLHKVTCKGIQELLWSEKDINFNHVATRYKRGRCVVKKEGKWVVDNEIPEFNKDRAYIEDLLKVEDEEQTKENAACVEEG